MYVLNKYLMNGESMSPSLWDLIGKENLKVAYIIGPN